MDINGAKLNPDMPEVLNLDGIWRFTYGRDTGEGEIPVIPEACRFTAGMPVPGYWDDNMDLLETADFSSSLQFNPGYEKIEFPMDRLRDASLPYITGVGWYRTCFFIPEIQAQQLTILEIGGIRTEAWVWVNGNFAGYCFGHSTPFEIKLDALIKAGQANELTIAVSNLRRDRPGSATRGYKGYSAGIYRSVYIKRSIRTRIKSCYVYPGPECSELNWNIELEGETGAGGSILYWKIRDPETGFIFGSGSEAVQGSQLSMNTGTFGMQAWSDNSPRLYRIELELRDAGKKTILDLLTQSFGLRHIACRGTRLEMNGRPIYLRGATEHCYFPLTCTPPADVESYREIVKKLKQLGFNWLRFHTWVPPEEYMQAADELGMMIQVEPPKGFSLEEWTNILLACRKHPSVIIYCCGNEELLDEPRIAYLESAAGLCRKYVPDALFNPMEALRGIEYCWEESDFGDAVAEEPFRHNAKRLKELKRFADVFGQWCWGFLSYSSSKGDWREIDNKLALYEKPCLSHELGIYGSYIDLELEQRYTGTRIGADLYSAAREQLEEAEVLCKAGLYYKNSCEWMRILRKHNLETARKCRKTAGYDYLGAIDYQWHRCGYPCGILNEFYEMKPGTTVEDLLKYNGESVLLLDHTNRRNFFYGQDAGFDILASLYGSGRLQSGTLTWYLADSRGYHYQSGEISVSNIETGETSKLGRLAFTVPYLEKPARLTLFARLSGDGYELVNDWDFWAFPFLDMSAAGPGKKGTSTGKYGNILTVTKIDHETLEYLEKGESVLLLGCKPFEALPVEFQPMSAGRPAGNFATVIYAHPALEEFPHEGFCDWQFYAMMEDGAAAVFNDTGIPFDPVIEIVSSFKMVKKQAALFEIGVGKGKLLVYTFNPALSDPAGAYMLHSLVKYAESEYFKPRFGIGIEVLAKLMETDRNMPRRFSTDQAYDSNAQTGK